MNENIFFALFTNSSRTFTMQIIPAMTSIAWLESIINSFQNHKSFTWHASNNNNYYKDIFVCERFFYIKLHFSLKIEQLIPQSIKLNNTNVQTYNNKLLKIM